MAPPSCLAWGAGGLVAGTRAGGLLLLDPRAPRHEPRDGDGLFFDREVRSLRWDSTGRRLAVTADDAVVKVVEVRGSGVVEVYQDRRHSDYVRGLAWAGDTLWSAGWDTAVLTHTLQ
jgi:WD40 repeat protein